MYKFSYKCLDVTFDYYDSERVLKREDLPYYLTPHRLAKIEAWMIKNNIEKIRTKEQLDYIIDQGWLSKYDSN